MFALFDHLLLSSGTVVHDTVPYVLARVVSSLLNFFLNQKMVFQSREKTARRCCAIICWQFLSCWCRWR